MSEVVHADLLRLYCRICSRRTLTATAGEGGRYRATPKYHPYIKKILFYLHDVDVSKESDSLYPVKVCAYCVQKCHGMMKKVENAQQTESQSDLVELGRQFALADFWAHTSIGCSICEDEAYDGMAVEEPPPSQPQPLSVPQIPVAAEQFTLVLSKDKVAASVAAFVNRKPGPAKSKGTWVAGPSRPLNLGKAIDVTRTKNTGTPLAVTPAKLDSDTKSLFLRSLPMDKEFRADVLKEFLMSSSFLPVTRRLQSTAGVKFIFGKPFNRPKRAAERVAAVRNSIKVLDNLSIDQKVLAMVSAIIDTVQDGRLSILASVGIKIDIMHPKMLPLLRKIRSSISSAAMETLTAASSVKRRPASTVKKNNLHVIKSKLGASNVTITPNGASKETSPAPSRHSSRKRKITDYSCFDNDNDDDLLEVMAIPPSKVLASSSSSASAPLASEVSPKTKESKKVIKIALTKHIPNAPSRIEVQKMFEKAKRDKKLFLENCLPKNKQMQADIFRDLLMLKWPSQHFRSLEAQGITIYHEEGQYHHVDDDNYFVPKRKEYKLLCEAKLRYLTTDKFTNAMSRHIFELLTPDDTRTLNHVGIFIDPQNLNVPAFYRVQSLIKDILLSSTSTQLGNDLCDYIYTKTDLESEGFPKDPISMANSLPDYKHVQAGVPPGITVGPAKKLTKAELAKVAKAKAPTSTRNARSVAVAAATVKQAQSQPQSRKRKRARNSGRQPHTNYSRRSRTSTEELVTPINRTIKREAGLRAAQAIQESSMDPLIFEDGYQKLVTTAEIEYTNANDDDDDYNEQDPLMMMEDVHNPLVDAEEMEYNPLDDNIQSYMDEDHNPLDTGDSNIETVDNLLESTAVEGNLLETSSAANIPEEAKSEKKSDLFVPKKEIKEEGSPKPTYKEKTKTNLAKEENLVEKIVGKNRDYNHINKKKENSNDENIHKKESDDGEKEGYVDMGLSRGNLDVDSLAKESFVDKELPGGQSVKGFKKNEPSVDKESTEANSKSPESSVDQSEDNSLETQEDSSVYNCINTPQIPSYKSLDEPSVENPLETCENSRLGLKKPLKKSINSTEISRENGCVSQPFDKPSVGEVGTHDQQQGSIPPLPVIDNVFIKEELGE